MLVTSFIFLVLTFLLAEWAGRMQHDERAADYRGVLRITEKSCHLLLFFLHGPVVLASMLGLIWTD